jgi:hypothetical protein
MLGGELPERMKYKVGEGARVEDGKGESAGRLNRGSDA